MNRRKTDADRELVSLLVQELERHLVVLEAQPPHRAAVHHALHTLKGSAAVAGELELAAVFERLNRRLKGGEESVIDQAAGLAHSAIDRLRAGEPAVLTRWPIPPDDLTVSSLDPLARAQYAAEVSDRLVRIDEALAARANPLEAARAIYRHIHSMKGAAGAVSDEPMSWFCHGLEDKLEAAKSVDAAQAAIQQVAQWRVVLGALLDEPESALGTLRASARASPTTRPPVANTAPRRPRESEPPRTVDDSDATIRVPSKEIDRLLERFDEIDLVREALASRVERARESAVGLRGLRSALIDAIRLIGPPRPWGAPAAAVRGLEHVVAALAAFSDDLDLASGRLSAGERTLRDDISAGKKQLSAMRQTAVKRIFARLTTAIDSEAHRSGRVVIVRTRGAEETVDRRVADQLVEPCLQLVRNAVAHGIEPPEVRATLGKPTSGTIALAAQKLGNRLSITIEDDGAGVDVREIRARAVNAGLVSPAIAEVVDEDTLLWLLFVPGFSTRDSSDLLAGRGIGLEIARTVTQRMGGAIRLSSRAGEGFSAHIDVPIESGVVSVLWVAAGESEFAIPAANARRVRKNDGPDAMRVPHLLSCFDTRVGERASYVVDLALPNDNEPQAPVAIGVDAVHRAEEVLVRRLGPLVAGLGPFAGAIVRGDGSLRLAIDPWALAPRARAYTAAHFDAHPSLRG